jgi:hypothetical protein
MTSVAPDEVVMVWETGVGRWRVAVLPPEVRTSTEVSETETYSVAVLPFEVTTWETTGDEATVMLSVTPDGLT